MDENAKLSWARDLPGSLLKKWPKDENGEYVTAAYLTSCGQQDMGDAVLISMLDSCGIPCLRKYPHYGGFGNLMLGISAEGVDLYVPETMLEDAKALLEGVPENGEEL